LRLGRFHLPRGLSAALTVLFSLAVLAGLIALISQQVATGFPSLRVQAADGLQDIRRRLADGPLHLTSGQLDSYAEAVIERVRNRAMALEIVDHLTSDAPLTARLRKRRLGGAKRTKALRRASSASTSSSPCRSSTPGARPR
jgi:hypothetical protein